MREAVDAPAPLIALWQAVALGRPFALGRTLEESEIAWAIETGMAPLLYAVTRDAPEHLPAALAPRLQAAERWARVQSMEMLEATAEIVDRCADRAVPLTLLKGISICGQYYAAPHQRFLGDIDLLVEPEDAPAASAALAELGYRAPQALRALDYSEHHHLAPVRHPRTRVCVELHSALFPSGAGLDRGGPFAPDTLRLERRPSTLEGRSVFRLSPELQVLYIASHWALDFVPAAGAKALLDMTLLMRAEAEGLDWGRILCWLEDRRIAAHLQLMLSHLETKELVELPAELRSDRKRVAVLPLGALRLLSGMVDRYQVLGLMRHVRPIVPAGSPDAAVAGRNRGTFRSRLRTLSSAFASGNFTGLLPILDSALWERALERPRSVWTRALVPWGRLFPPGDPDRFRPGHQFRRLLGVSGHEHRARGEGHRC